MKKHTFSDWWDGHKGMTWFYLRRSHGGRGIGGLVYELWYYIKCRLWKHYGDRVYIESLSPTWVDRDEVLLHACFQILKDYIEKEEPFKSLWLEHRPTCSGAVYNEFDCENCGAPKDQVEFGREIRALYAWWMVDRPARLLALEKAMDLWHDNRNTDRSRELLLAHSRLEQAGELEDEIMLVRLISIRQSLWT